MAEQLLGEEFSCFLEELAGGFAVGVGERGVAGEDDLHAVAGGAEARKPDVLQELAADGEGFHPAALFIHVAEPEHGFGQGTTFEVDGMEHDAWLLGDAGKNLHGRLAIDIHGQVHDLATMLEAVRGGIAPAACEIQPHGAAGPDDLVLKDAALGVQGLELRVVDQEALQPGKSLLFKRLGAGLAMLTGPLGLGHQAAGLSQPLPKAANLGLLRRNRTILAIVHLWNSTPNGSYSVVFSGI